MRFPYRRNSASAQAFAFRLALHMGIGHFRQTTFNFSPAKHHLSYGGELRKKKLGRGARPLSTKMPIHVVFKIRKTRLRSKSLRTVANFRLSTQLIKKYSKHFFVGVDQFSIQHDHIHLLLRTQKRSNFHNFFRVVSGQIAQRFEARELVTDTPAREGFWMHRPFSRVVKGWRGYQIVRNYIQLNEKEVTGKIRYQKKRLKGLSSAEWELLWAP